jgi:hypothetical protein
VRPGSTWTSDPFGEDCHRSPSGGVVAMLDSERLGMY